MEIPGLVRRNTQKDNLLTATNFNFSILAKCKRKNDQNKPAQAINDARFARVKCLHTLHHGRQRFWSFCNHIILQITSNKTADKPANKHINNVSAIP